MCGLDFGSAESIFKATLYVFQVSAATGSGGLSPNSFYAPIIVTEGSRGVRALWADFFLIMKRPISAAAAERVCLGISFTETSCSFGLHITAIR